MIKNCISVIVFLFSICSFAQVGINTNTPTEKLDINGTLRVRSLPNDGQANSIYTTGANTNSGSTPTMPFVAGRPVVTDANGVMGTTTYSDLVPNSTLGSATFNTSNTSASMFVVKRFHLVDNVGTTTVLGRFHPNRTAQVNDTAYPFNGDTGMAVNNWQAIISNISYKLKTATTATQDQFKLNDFFNYRLKGAAGGNWQIVGDIINIQEEAYVDVLFIRSSVVAADNRAN